LALGLFIQAASIVSAQIPPDQVEHLLRAREQEVRGREADVASKRLDIIKRAMELEADRKQVAKTEQQRAERTLEQLNLQLAEKEWALRQFEPAERGLVPLLQNAPKIQERWQRIRQISRNKFVNFPEQSRQQIKTGEALNFFLDTCGPTVLALQLQREQSEIEQRSAETRTAIGRRQELLGKDSQGSDVRAALLNDLHGTKSLGREHLQELVLVKGLVGNKLSVHLGTLSNDSTLPLDWPLMLLDDEYGPLRKFVEESKHQAIEELAGGSISARARGDMMKGVDGLCDAFESKNQARLNELRKQIDRTKGGILNSDSSTWMSTRNFLRDLRRGATRFLEARTPQDVEAGEFPPSDRRNVSVDELLAYMCRHGLRFGRAETTTSEVAQDLVYRLLIQYYFDLYSLRLALESDRRTKEYSEAEIANLKKIQFERFSDPTSESWMSWRAGSAPGFDPFIVDGVSK
jgi:hypothetical protein